jgi:hypothetical protein
MAELFLSNVSNLQAGVSPFRVYYGLWQSFFYPTFQTCKQAFLHLECYWQGVSFRLYWVSNLQAGVSPFRGLCL